MKDRNNYQSFVATGSIDTDPVWRPVEDYNGNIVSFKKPDGTIIQLAIALEVITRTGEIKYVTNEKEMNELGFFNLQYNELMFKEEIHNA